VLNGYGKEPIGIEFEMVIGQILADQEKWSYSTDFWRCPTGLQRK